MASPRRVAIRTARNLGEIADQITVIMEKLNELVDAQEALPAAVAAEVAKALNGVEVEPTPVVEPAAAPTKQGKAKGK